MLGEGYLEELETLLGYLSNTRDFTITLLGNKVKSWTGSIYTLLRQNTISHKILEIFFDKLDQQGHIISYSHHFVNQISKPSIIHDPAHGLSREGVDDVLLEDVLVELDGARTGP